MGRPLTQCPTACQPLPKQISGAFYSGRPKVQTSGWPQSSVFLRLEEPGHLCLRGKGPSPTFPPSGASLGEEREGAGFSSSPLPPSKLYIKIPIQSSHREKKKRKKESPTLNPAHLTATDGDIWREGGGAKKIPINLNSMMVTINSTTNVYLNGKRCWAFERSSSRT